MQPVLSAEGAKINWVNYKTGAKNIYFRMQAAKGAEISIELSHNDEEARLDHYNRLLQLRSVFQRHINEQWVWEEAMADEHGRIISRICTGLAGVNIFNKADWPALISFFKPRLIALDAFWSEVKHEFEVW